MNDPDETVFVVACPCCGESVEIYVEPDVAGRFVQDCEVCCQPWDVVVRRDEGGIRIDVRPAQ